MKKVLITILCIIIGMMVNAQTFNQSIQLNLQMVADTTLHPFTGNPMTSIGISGHITFTSKLGFVRFVVNDNYDDEYMIYESYRLFENDSSFNFSQKCEESCFFESYVPTELIVQMKDAIVTINSLELSNTHYSNAEYQRKMAATTADNTKLSSVQNYISDNGLIWIAGHTKLSDLSYASKAKLWGKNYMSYGFEYYAGGFYSLFSPNSGAYEGTIDYTGRYVDNFDWRNRHGANNPNSTYYDQDPDGSGWLSPLTCQLGCWENGVFSCGPESECNGEYRSVGTCWDFGPTAQIEALANLYYNEHLDLDLSEQYIACAEQKMESWYPNRAFYHYQNEGVPYESCWPYTASLDNCESVCQEPIDRVSISSYTQLSGNTSVSTIRNYLIQRGPMTASSIPNQTWTSHCMLLVGWGTIDESSPVASGLPQGSIPETWYGATYWIYKNSYGITSDYNMFGGYSYIIHNQDGTGLVNAPTCYLVSLPITVPGKTTNDINCFDRDGDGYYNWGIGLKPNHCPLCPDEPDGDDTNPGLGPLNEYGQCTIINTYNASFETGWDNWVQEYFPNDPGNVDYDWWRHSGPTNHGNTGPQSAQNGNYYIYANGSFPGYTTDVVSILSPPIDFRQSNACNSMVDFYYHMKSSNYGHPEGNKLVLSYRRHGSSPNSWAYEDVAINNQGDEWQHATFVLPIDVEQIRFFALKGEGACDVALDNITIGLWNYNETPIVVNDNQLWDDNMVLNQDVVVESGGCLTIKKNSGNNLKVQLHSDAKIIVKPGGHLILDHCTLTSMCSNEMWQGIEVWGDINSPQQEINGSYPQGFIELKNGAVIENAKCAVELWRPNYWNTTGGIIHATDATFRNNAKAVHALHYHNNLYGREGDYNGYFRSCTFIINEHYLGTETFYKHIDIEQVKGLDFWGCSFYANRNVSGVSPYCVGIGAYTASFRLNSYCGNTNITPCPEEYMIRPSFNGFYQGIHASGNGKEASAFSVRNSVFEDNTCGIYALNSGYSTIVNNDFTMSCNSDCDFGIYIDEVSGFCIEDNTFRSKPSATGMHHGIGIVKSNGVNDVYHNDFHGLYCGNVAIGDSTSFSHPNDSTLGITYTCNKNTNNVIDFCVLKDDNFGDIASMQGSLALPAGNTFSGSLYHFYNDGEHMITYYYDISDPDQTPATSMLYRVNVKDAQGSNSCLSHYSGGSVSKSASEKAALASDYLSARSIYNSLLQLYESRIDGGSTPTQVADINSATSSDLWRLRAQLLGLSPYVSGEVLTTAADRYDVFTDPILFEILAANPDELKKDTLISYLENKEHPLPTYMTDLLRQMASGFTARTALLAQMAQYRHAYSLAAGDIVRSCLNDSVTDLAELRTWLGNMDDIASDRMIVASYLQEGDSTNAFTLANMLPVLYNLQGDALADHLDYMHLIGLYQTLNREHRSVFELTDTEIALVNGIASSGIGTSRSMADALLEEISENHSRAYSCPTMPENNNGNRGNVGPVDALMNEALGFTVSVSPNPATTWTAMEYTLPANLSFATAYITNTLGIIVMSTELNSKQGQRVLNLSDLPNGIYTYIVRCGDYTNTGKLIIAK